MKNKISKYLIDCFTGSCRAIGKLIRAKPTIARDYLMSRDWDGQGGYVNVIWANRNRHQNHRDKIRNGHLVFSNTLTEINAKLKPLR